MSTIIVSTFLININSRTDNQIQKYIELGKKLISVPVNKLIFIDESLFEEFKDYRNDVHTQIVFMQKEIFYLYEYKDQIKNFELETTDPTKDTLDYIFTMCHKTEYIRQAIHLCGEDKHYVWLDFGINHIMTCTDEEFVNKIIRLSEQRYNKVRVGAIWGFELKFKNVDPSNDEIWNFDTSITDLEYKHNMYKSIFWGMAGGVIGGDSASLKKLADLVKEKCIQIITERKKLMWETNVWYMVYVENKDLFDLYLCDHNNTLIDEY